MLVGIQWDYVLLCSLTVPHAFALVMSWICRNAAVLACNGDLDMVGVTGSIPVAPTTQSDTDGSGILPVPNIGRFPPVNASGEVAGSLRRLESAPNRARFGGLSLGRFQKCAFCLFWAKWRVTTLPLPPPIFDQSREPWWPAGRLTRTRGTASKTVRTGAE